MPRPKRGTPCSCTADAPKPTPVTRPPKTQDERLELALDAAHEAITQDLFLTPLHTRALIEEIAGLRGLLRTEKREHLQTINQIQRLRAESERRGEALKKRGALRGVPQPVQG
jgi:hypothetical protein